MRTSVPIRYASDQYKWSRVFILLAVSLVIGIICGFLRNKITGPIHFETLIAMIVMVSICIIMLITLVRVPFVTSAKMLCIEISIAWILFGIGWVIGRSEVHSDLQSVIVMSWLCTLLPSLLILWLRQKLYPLQATHQCPQCGYDRSESTSERCSECGSTSAIHS